MLIQESFSSRRELRDFSPMRLHFRLVSRAEGLLGGGVDNTGIRRRLAAILAADAAGYSRLMAADEQATVAALDAARTVFRTRIESNQGRVIDMAGDSVLAVFETAIGAVSAALAVQQELDASSSAIPEDSRMRFRIGVHLGDVIEKADGTVYGDGVNIAARLQALAEVGGVTVSDSVRNAVKGKASTDFADMGEQQVKNIPEPVRAFRLVLKADASAAASEAPKPALELPDKPSLAVLPFTNMSGDPEQEYFADGVVDDIISALSRVRAFFVIARNSSFTYKGKAVDIKQVGRELGVRYVLEGSIRKAGNKVRIVGQLIEAENGRHIWADRFEGNLDDIFELQDRITESVVGAIEPNLRLAEIERARAKPTANLHAYDLCLRALPNLMATTTRAANDEALNLLQRAITMDPGYSFAKASRALAYVLRKAQMWITPVEIEEGLRLAEEALADHRDDPTTLTYVGQALGYLGFRHDDALRALDRALTINPNSTRALIASGWGRTYVGDAAKSIEHLQRAIRLNPLDPEMGYMLSGLGIAYQMAGKSEEALAMGQKSLQESPNWIPSHLLIVRCLVQLGSLDEAKNAAQRMMKLAPGMTLTARRAQMANRDQAYQESYISALRAAGVPE
jgi:adenylate cyclase